MRHLPLGLQICGLPHSSWYDNFSLHCEVTDRHIKKQLLKAPSVKKILVVVMKVDILAVTVGTIRCRVASSPALASGYLFPIDFRVAKT